MLALSQRRSSLVCVLLLAAMITPAVGNSQEAVAADEQVFRSQLEALNREFRDLHTDFSPVQRGGVTLHMRSPRHRITVHSHRLTVRTVSDAPPGTFDAWLTVELDADGDLEATIQETGTELRDRVVAPRQTVRVASRLRVIAEEGGFAVEIVKPYLHTLDVQIESQLASRVVASCSSLGIFLAGLDCAALETALAVAKVPMPAVGETFWLPADRLSEADVVLLRSWAGLGDRPLDE